MSGSKENLRVDGYDVAVSHPDKILFDDDAITKRDLAEYYRAAGAAMLPHVRERPLAMHRFPEGINAEGFFQKRRPDHAPDWVGAVRVEREQGGAVTMVSCSTTAVLVWLANQAVITVHPWLSRNRALHRPDRLIIDIDPPEDDFARVRRAAGDVRAVLEEAGLLCYVMTTGSRGVHVVTPLRPERDFDDVRALSHELANRAAQRHPRSLTTEVRKNKRGDRVFLDTLRNAYAQHAVAPYSVRPLPGAPVATPLTWEELDATASARVWTVHTVGPRLAADPWRDMARHARSPARLAHH
ncbi:non-homologous end-joining DNA ligase [Salinactinospora qingdaonensis]|uniref:Non-homologous end-joining DNA ligase n=1 Tax=Salinactinospora qingdaonensis TaxID=702744 RepID=A0ABP7FNA0_9ACTN